MANPNTTSERHNTQANDATTPADALLARLSALEQQLSEVEALKAHQAEQDSLLARQDVRLAEQEAELARLRAQPFTVEAPDPDPAPPTPIADRMLVLPEHLTDGRSSRRGMLGRAAAAFAALGLAGGVAGTAHAQTNPPNPKTPSNFGNLLALQLGTLNTATASTDITEVQNPGTTPAQLIFHSANFPGGTLPTNGGLETFAVTEKISLAATNTYGYSGATGNAAIASGDRHHALYAKARNANALTVEGFWPLTIVPSGIGAAAALPDADSGGNKVDFGTFFLQNNLTGLPVISYNNTLWMAMGSGLLLTPQPNWRRLASSFFAGILTGITPVRVLDTRPTGGGNTTIGFKGDGTPLPATGDTFPAVPAAPGATHTYRIAGKGFGSGGNAITFPATDQLRGLLINVTIVGNPGGGFVTVYPGDATLPNTSTVNPSTFIAANSTFVQVPISGANAGNINVTAVGGDPRDVIIDVVGYYT